MGMHFLANRKWTGVGVLRYKAKLGSQPLPFFWHWPESHRTFSQVTQNVYSNDKCLCKYIKKKFHRCVIIRVQLLYPPFHHEVTILRPHDHFLISVQLSISQFVFSYTNSVALIRQFSTCVYIYIFISLIGCMLILKWQNGVFKVLYIWLNKALRYRNDLRWLTTRGKPLIKLWEQYVPTCTSNLYIRHYSFLKRCLYSFHATPKVLKTGILTDFGALFMLRKLSFHVSGTALVPFSQKWRWIFFFYRILRFGKSVVHFVYNIKPLCNNL